MSQRAAFTVADNISRETDPVNAEYIQGMADVHTYLIRGSHASRMRVTAISYNDTDDQFEVIWSHTPDSSWSNLDTGTLQDLADRIPIMAAGDVAILVEAQVRYVPFLNVGIGPSVVDSFVVTRPRFGPQLVWENADGTLITYGS